MYTRVSLIMAFSFRLIAISRAIYRSVITIPSDLWDTVRRQFHSHCLFLMVHMSANTRPTPGSLSLLEFNFPESTERRGSQVRQVASVGRDCMLLDGKKVARSSWFLIDTRDIARELELDLWLIISFDIWIRLLKFDIY